MIRQWKRLTVRRFGTTAVPRRGTDHPGGRSTQLIKESDSPTSLPLSRPTTETEVELNLTWSELWRAAVQQTWGQLNLAAATYRFHIRRWLFFFRCFINTLLHCFAGPGPWRAETTLKLPGRIYPLRTNINVNKHFCRNIGEELGRQFQLLLDVSFSITS